MSHLKCNSDPFTTHSKGPDRPNTRLSFKLRKQHVLMSLFPGNNFIRFPSEGNNNGRKKKNLILPLGVISCHELWDESEMVHKLICDIQELKMVYL